LGAHSLQSLQGFFADGATARWWSYPPLSETAYSPNVRPRRIYTYRKASTHRKTVHS
jgi:heme/copper-type cytochrome/quinol oxidase subunit 1